MPNKEDVEWAIEYDAVGKKNEADLHVPTRKNTQLSEENYHLTEDKHGVSFKPTKHNCVHMYGCFY